MSKPGRNSANSQAIAQQHLGWMKQYIGAMNERNWKDLRDQLDNQVERLADHLGVNAEIKPHPEGRRICKCACGGTVYGIDSFGRLFTACDTCTPSRP